MILELQTQSGIVYIHLDQIESVKQGNGIIDVRTKSGVTHMAFIPIETILKPWKEYLSSKS